jgi:hypothetical protein
MLLEFRTDQLGSELDFETFLTAAHKNGVCITALCFSINSVVPGALNALRNLLPGIEIAT